MQNNRVSLGGEESLQKKLETSREHAKKLLQGMDEVRAFQIVKRQKEGGRTFTATACKPWNTLPLST